MTTITHMIFGQNYWRENCVTWPEYVTFTYKYVQQTILDNAMGEDVKCHKVLVVVSSHDSAIVNFQKYIVEIDTELFNTCMALASIVIL